VSAPGLFPGKGPPQLPRIFFLTVSNGDSLHPGGKPLRYLKKTLAISADQYFDIQQNYSLFSSLSLPALLARMLRLLCS